MIDWQAQAKLNARAIFLVARSKVPFRESHFESRGEIAVALRILVVDDSPVELRLVGRLLEKNFSELTVDYAVNGRKALQAIAAVMPDLIITDLRMPEMNGLELVEQIKAAGHIVPVILMTSFGNEQIAVQALHTGAASYVPKLLLDTHLIETAKSVLDSSQRQSKRRQALSTLDFVELRFSLENDTSMIAPLISYLQEQLALMRLFDEVQLTRVGVALHETLTNAIHHGNLELDSDLRQQDEKVYYELAEERRRQPPYSSRRVQMTAKLTAEEMRVVIKDEGVGFDPNAVRNPTDEFNLDRIGGRGLLLIRAFMDVVQHNALGNEVTIAKRACPRNADL